MMRRRVVIVGKIGCECRCVDVAAFACSVGWGKNTIVSKIWKTERGEASGHWRSVSPRARGDKTKR